MKKKVQYKLERVLVHSPVQVGRILPEPNLRTKGCN